MRKVRHAVIGVGIMGKGHAKIAHEIDEMELVAIADVNEGLARSVGEEFKVKWYTDYIEMLEREKPDSVSICTPHFLHRDMAIEVAKRGIHVLVEKPIAISVKEADDMIKTARKSGVKLGVVFQHRFTEKYRKLRELIVEQGTLGDLLFASLEYFCYRSQPYYNMARWRGTWKYEGGGVLINQAIHFIDLFQWIIGIMPKRVAAFSGTLLHKIEVEDVAAASLDFENGAKGTLSAASISEPSYIRMRVQGDRGAVYFEHKMNKESATIAFFSPPIKEAMFMTTDVPWGLTPEVEEDVLILPDIKGGHEAALRDFARAIIEDKEPAIPGEEGLKSLEIVNAIILSSFKGSPVEIPVNREEYEKVLSKLRCKGELK